MLASDLGGVMAREGLRVREVSEVEGDRLLRIVRRDAGGGDVSLSPLNQVWTSKM